MYQPSVTLMLYTHMVNSIEIQNAPETEESLAQLIYQPL